MSIDVSDVDAGQYRLLSVQWDEITSKGDEPLMFIRHHQGDIVNLSAENARRLVSCGAACRPGQEPATLAAQENARSAVRSMRAALAALPPAARELMPHTDLREPA